MIKRIFRESFSLNFLMIVVVLLTGFSCSYDKEPISMEGSHYPESVAKILVAKCTDAGCHNTQSKDGAGGFDLSTWNHLFEGGRNEPCVVSLISILITKLVSPK